VTGYLTNRLWEFRHIYNLGTFGDRDLQVSFEVIRSKVKFMTRPILKGHGFKGQVTGNLSGEAIPVSDLP